MYAIVGALVRQSKGVCATLNEIVSVYSSWCCDLDKLGSPFLKDVYLLPNVMDFIRALVSPALQLQSFKACRLQCTRKKLT